MTVFSGAARLAGAMVPATPAPKAPAMDLSALTNDQLGELCRERGITPPKRATKRQLVELLST